MREIKFRGKRLNNGEWVYGYLYQTEFDAYIIQEQGFQAKPDDVYGPAEYETEPVWIQVDPETVGQLTGLKDKNGVEIYEGDVVALRTPSPIPDTPVKVYFNKKFAAFVTDALIDRAEFRLMTQDTGYEVIGDIYENPELLESPRLP